MREFHIDLEWEESPHARAQELSATWARLAIYADELAVTKVEDHRSHSVRNGIPIPATICWRRGKALRFRI